MHVTRRRLSSAIAIATLTVFLSLAAPRAAEAQLSDQTIVISEFFEEIFRLDPGGTPIDILDSNPFDSPFGQLVEALDPNTIIISSFSELFRFNVGTGETTQFADLSFSPREITRSGPDTLIAVGTGGVVEVNVASGVETEIFDATFFSPSDAVVAEDGRIFVTEFFDSLGVVDPVAGTFDQIGDFGANQFSSIDIGPDGNLVLASFDELFLVDPISELSSSLEIFEPGTIQEINVNSDGGILFSGTGFANGDLFLFDPISGSTSTVIQGDNIDPFFSILDFDVFEPGFRSVNAVPEPSGSVLLIALTAVGSIRRRRQPAG